jgi:hypothetical protein
MNVEMGSLKREKIAIRVESRAVVVRQNASLLLGAFANRRILFAVLELVDLRVLEQSVGRALMKGVITLRFVRGPVLSVQRILLRKMVWIDFLI